MDNTKKEDMMVQGRYHVDCFDAAGNLKWEEDFDNLVTDQGKKHLLDNGLAGPATAVVARMSYIASGTPVSTSTYASPVVVECATAVVGNTRTTPAFSAASGATTVSKATSAAVVLTLAGAGTVSGIGINVLVGAVGNLYVPGDVAVSGAILYSAGLFGSPKIVSTNDVLNVTYTTSLN